MQGPDIFTVQMHGDVVIKGNNGQRFLGRGLVIHGNRAEIPRWSACLEPFAYIVMGNDGCLLLKICIPAGVVAMVVGVDDKANRLVSDALERGLNFFRQWRVLVIDNNDAV